MNAFIKSLQQTGVVWVIVTDPKSCWDGSIGKFYSHDGGKSRVCFHKARVSNFDNDKLAIVEIFEERGPIEEGDLVLVSVEDDTFSLDRSNYYGYIGEVETSCEGGRVINFGIGDTATFKDGYLTKIGFKRTGEVMKKENPRPEDVGAVKPPPPPAPPNDKVIALKDVRRMDIKPGEVILVTIPMMPKWEEYASLTLSCFKHAFHDTKIVIIHPGIRVEIVSPEIGDAAEKELNSQKD
jgi:hypothetical protein